MKLFKEIVGFTFTFALVIGVLAVVWAIIKNWG